MNRFAISQPTSPRQSSSGRSGKEKDSEKPEGHSNKLSPQSIIINSIAADNRPISSHLHWPKGNPELAMAQRATLLQIPKCLGLTPIRFMEK